MAIRVFFALLLLSYQFINVARCKSDDDGAEAAAEVAADSEELRIFNDDMVDGLNDMRLIAAPGVDTVCVFSKNSAKGMQAGEKTERLVGINYDGDSSVNAVAKQATQHLGVCCPIQWRDHIIVERIVFDLDEEGVKDVSYVKMAFIPRGEVTSWSHLLENLGSYSIPSYISVHVTSVLVYQYGWDWEEGAHEFTPEGYLMKTSTSYTSGSKIDFDDYLTVLERVRVIVFPFVHKWKENKVYNPYAVDDTTIPPPPSPPFGVNLKIGNEYYLVRENERGDIIHWCVVCKNFCPASEDPGTLEAYDYDDAWLGMHSIRWTPTLRVDYIEFLSVGGRISSFTVAHLRLLQNRDTMANHLRLSLGSFWRMDSVGLLVKTGTHTWSIQVASPYLGVLSVSVGLLFLAFSGIIGWRRKRTTRHYPLTLDLSFPRWIDFRPPPKFNTFRSPLPLIPRLSSTSWKFDGDDEGELVDGSKSMEVTLEGGHGYKH